MSIPNNPYSERQYNAPLAPPVYSSTSSSGPFGKEPASTADRSNFALPKSPSASPVPQTTGLRNLAPGQSVEKLLDPPPPCFQRPPPLNPPYAPFEPMSLNCLGSTLDKGFISAAPPSVVTPHPFVLHDVTEEDWQWFLYHIKTSASLTPSNRVGAGLVPLALGIGMYGMIVGPVIERQIKKRKSGAVVELINHWNAYFFNLRHVHVDLVQVDVSSPGSGSDSDDPPPDDLAQCEASDDVVLSGGPMSKKDRKHAEKAMKKEEKRNAKTARKAQKEQRKKQKSVWRLVVAYKP